MLVFSSNVFAVSFLSFDPRSMALGGAGVASSPIYNATLFNPALLVTSGKSNVFFSVPYLGARILDRDGFINAVDEYQKNNAQLAFDTQLQLAKTRFNQGTLVSNDIRVVAGAAAQWQNDLNNLSNKPLRVSASYQLSAGKTGHATAWGAHYRRYYVVGAQINFNQDDQQQISKAIRILNIMADIADNVEDTIALANELDLSTLEALINTSIDSGELTSKLEDYFYLPGMQQLIEEAIDTGRLATDLKEYLRLNDLEAALKDPDAINNPPQLNQYIRYKPSNKLQSTIAVQGAFISESSIGFATAFANFQGVTVGINLKQLQLTTIDFETDIADVSAGEVTSKGNQTEYNKFNADIGVSYHFNSTTKMGLVVKNVLPYDFLTALDNTIKYRPLARFGVSYQGTFFHLVGDVDLTSNDPIGFDPNKQYASLGIELPMTGYGALRFGVRKNLVNGATLPSIGLGFSTNQLNVDIAVAKSEKNDELGAALQIGLTF
ncbi:conjugal transfer protein TraF [Psychrosphaera sp. B3R10]|uniref:conjugal transfer protein TraF n=1 Tax=Psychrosphaera sp. B3R10 TaxID=2841569 RepID=UPI001C0821F1|nr:conjugal transfer protein TraF [Psychrosphaera sp. B3R10]MBU2883438.1 conjugal transfer protein TraF [Psychrosphaera sp. I2R16]MBU2990468.1 conjugal transfer protein TraF [Psychrosphaera sp. B3R10]